MQFNKNKAQGTLEYLVIIGIVIVISLAITMIFTNISGNNSTSINKASTTIGSRIGTGGISIIESVSDNSGNGIIRLNNNSGDSLTITKISAVDSSGNRSNVPYPNTYIASQTAANFSIIYLSSYCSCGANDTTKTCTFEINYTASSGLTKTQLVTTTVNCVSSTQATGNVINPSLYTPFIWVTNYSGSSISKLNGSSGALIGTYPVGNQPFGVAVDASGNVWVTNHDDSSVSKLNGSSGALIGTYPVGNYPDGVAVDASGNVWVTNHDDSSVSKLNGSSGALIGTYPVGSSAFGVAVDANGNVWVVNSTDNNVSKLNGSSGALIGTYPVGSMPYGVAVDANGNIWVINTTNVSKLNGSSGALIGTYSAGGSTFGLGDLTGFALQYFVLGRR